MGNVWGFLFIGFIVVVLALATGGFNPGVIGPSNYCYMNSQTSCIVTDAKDLPTHTPIYPRRGQDSNGNYYDPPTGFDTCRVSGDVMKHGQFPEDAVFMTADVPYRNGACIMPGSSINEYAPNGGIVYPKVVFLNSDSESLPSEEPETQPTQPIGGTGTAEPSEQITFYDRWIKPVIDWLLSLFGG